MQRHGIWELGWLTPGWWFQTGAWEPSLLQQLVLTQSRAGPQQEAVFGVSAALHKYLPCQSEAFLPPIKQDFAQSLPGPSSLCPVQSEQSELQRAGLPSSGTFICSMVASVSLAACARRGREDSSSSCIFATSSAVRRSCGSKAELRAGPAAMESPRKGLCCLEGAPCRALGCAKHRSCPGSC